MQVTGLFERLIMESNVANLEEYRNLKKCSCGRFIPFNVGGELCYYCVYDNLLEDAFKMEW